MRLISHHSDSLSNQLRNKYLERVCLAKRICLLWDEPHPGNSHFSHWLQKEFRVMNLSGDIYTVDLCIWSDKSTYSVHSCIERELASFPFVPKNMQSKFSFYFNILTISPLMGWEKLRTFGHLNLPFFFCCWDARWKNWFLIKSVEADHTSFLWTRKPRRISSTIMQRFIYDYRLFCVLLFYFHWHFFFLITR